MKLFFSDENMKSLEESKAYFQEFEYLENLYNKNPNDVQMQCTFLAYSFYFLMEGDLMGIDQKRYVFFLARVREFVNKCTNYPISFSSELLTVCAFVISLADVYLYPAIKDYRKASKDLYIIAKRKCHDKNLSIIIDYFFNDSKPPYPSENVRMDLWPTSLLMDEYFKWMTFPIISSKRF